MAQLFSLFGKPEPSAVVTVHIDTDRHDDNSAVLEFSFTDPDVLKAWLQALRAVTGALAPWMEQRTATLLASGALPNVHKPLAEMFGRGDGPAGAPAADERCPDCGEVHKGDDAGVCGICGNAHPNFLCPVAARDVTAGDTPPVD